MAIPPILANNPLLKFLKTEPSENVDNQEAVATTRPTQEDIIEISEFAQQRLDGIETLGTENTDRIQEVSSDTREALAEDLNLTLGLDPAFDT